MSRPIIVFSAISALIASLILLKSDYIKTDKGAMSDPQSRAEWEHMLLQDPVTGLIPVTRQQEIDFARNLPIMEWPVSRTEFYDWKARGPFNFGGRTRGLAMDVTNHDVLIAGSVSGGIFRTTDKGNTWNQVSTSDQNFGITCLVQDTRSGHENTWYAGSGEDYNSASYPNARFIGNGILKSDDGGGSWNWLESTVTSTPQTLDPWDRVWRIVVDQNATNDVLLAAVIGGIMRSEDGGESWTKVLGASNSGYYSEISVSATGIFYAMLSGDSPSKGIYRSTNGVDWTNIITSGFPSSYNRIVCGISPNNEDDVYFMAETPNHGKKFTNFRGDVEWISFWKYSYINGDGSGSGGFWEDRSQNLPRGPFKFDDLNVQGGYDMLVAVTPNDENSVIIGGTNLFRSSTAFEDSMHTTQIGGYKEDTDLPDFQVYPNHHPDQHFVFFDPDDGDKMYSGCDGGVFRTSNVNATPVVWESLNNGYNTTQFYTCAIDHATVGSDELMGGLQDNGTYHNFSDDPYGWTFPFSYDGAFTAIANNSEFHITSKQQAGIVKIALDANGNRTGFTRIDPTGGNNYYFIHPWDIDPNNSSILYLPLNTKLWRNDSVSSLAINDSFSTITTGWTQLPFNFSGTLSSVGISTKNPVNRVFAGTASGRIYRVENANSSSATNLDVTPSVGNAAFTNCIAVDPEDGNHAVAVFSNYNVHSILFTRNGGISWFRAGGNLEADSAPSGAPADFYNISVAPSVRWAEIMHVGLDTVYLVGTSVGLFGTNHLKNGIDRISDGTIWKKLSPDKIGNSVITMVDSRAADGYVAVATHGSGLYTTHMPFGWGVTGLSTTSDNELKLYPNPATLNQSLFLSSKTDGQVIDQQGRVLLQIKDTNKIDLSNLLSGVYYLKTKVETIKFIIL